MEKRRDTRLAAPNKHSGKIFHALEPITSTRETNAFTRYLLDKLRRHPKRIVFTEGEDLRVLRVAERLVKEEAAVPIPARLRANGFTRSHRRNRVKPALCKRARPG